MYFGDDIAHVDVDSFFFEVFEADVFLEGVEIFDLLAGDFLAF